MPYKYRLQVKTAIAMPNILGNHSMPVHTYRWTDIAVSNDKTAIEEHKAKLEQADSRREYRIETFGGE